MRIDSHHHLWDLTVRPQAWTDDLPVLARSFAMDELRPSLREHGIDATVLVQTVADPDETPEMLALAAEDPDIAGVVGWVDLTAPDVAERLAELASPHLVGIRHLVQGEPDPEWLTRPDVRRGIEAVGRAGLAYDLLVFPHQLPAAVAVVADLPDVRFVLDHCAKPVIRDGLTEPWGDLITQLAALPNVAVKLSGLVTEATTPVRFEDLQWYTDHVLAAFGPSRVMYGSDWPVCLLAAEYDEVVGLAEEAIAHLSEDERSLVFGTNAAVWYDLPS